MTIKIGSSVHATSDLGPAFSMHRQASTGAIALNIRSKEGRGVGELDIYLDDEALAQLRKAVATPVTFTEAIRAAVALRGRDYVYEPPAGFSCLYVHIDDGEAGCLIGTALHLLGIPLDQLAEGEGENAGYLMTSLDVGTDRERVAAMAAQEQQDTGHKWGFALDMYDKALAERS
jgi:hypothetical protein